MGGGSRLAEKQGKKLMKQPRKFIFLVLPVLGFVLGYVWAYADFHGLLETWHLAGKPEAKIARILGIREANKILVATETGSLFSFAFGDIFLNGARYEGEVWLPPNSTWEKEAQATVDPPRPLQYYGADFRAWPPLFRIVQQYGADYIYQVEGKGEVRFALAADGNLWMWVHQANGWMGLVFYLYPMMGFFAGLAADLVLGGVYWFNARRRGISG